MAGSTLFVADGPDEAVFVEDAVDGEMGSSASRETDASSSSSSSSSSANDDNNSSTTSSTEEARVDEFDPEVAAPTPYTFPLHIGPCRVRLECHRGRTRYDRLSITCAFHYSCEKKRGLGEAQTSHFGPREPLAFLAVWASVGGQYGSREAHVRDARPTKAQIEQWLQDNSERHATKHPPPTQMGF